METINHKRRVVIAAAAAVVLLMLQVALLNVEAGDAVTPATSLEACYGKCYPKCHVSNRFWCATLCVGKCKHGKSIPDNLCNCTYTCSKFRCADVGSDPEKVRRCVFQCSKLCNVTY